MTHAGEIALQALGLGLALGAAFLVDRSTEARGLLPPGFARSPLRRGAAFVVVAAFFWIGIFATVGLLGQHVEIDVAKLREPRLFLLHALMLLTLAVWFLLGFAGRGAAPLAPLARVAAEPPLESPLEPRLESSAPPEPPVPVPVPPRQVSLGRRFCEQFGLVAPSVPRELALGLGLGIVAWAAVIALLLVIVLILLAAGFEGVLPKRPPAVIPWIAALPFGLRLAVALSAGFFEELFFRGFLQPRIGILLSTALFTLAHLSYGQPFLLIGICALSLTYGLLVRWRQSIWVTVVAHSFFDGLQLLVIVPIVMRYLEGAGGAAKAAGTLSHSLLSMWAGG